MLSTRHIGRKELIDNMFLMWVMCFNCTHTVRLDFRKGTKVHDGTLNIIPCPDCKVRGCMKKVQWDGKKYVRLNA